MLVSVSCEPGRRFARAMGHCGTSEPSQGAACSGRSEEVLSQGGRGGGGVALFLREQLDMMQVVVTVRLSFFRFLHLNLSCFNFSIDSLIPLWLSCLYILFFLSSWPPFPSLTSLLPNFTSLLILFNVSSPSLWRCWLSPSGPITVMLDLLTIPGAGSTSLCSPTTVVRNIGDHKLLRYRV